MPSTDEPGAETASRSVDADLSARIYNTHGRELSELRAALTASSRRGDASRLGRRQHRAGPMPSAGDANINLTIVAETVEMGWFAAGPAPAGTCVTVSFAAHRKDAGYRTPLSLAECDAWMQALLDSSWMSQAYRCRCATGPAGEGVVSYRVFLDAAHKPVPKPAEVAAEACQPLSPVNFAS